MPSGPIKPPSFRFARRFGRFLAEHLALGHAPLKHAKLALVPLQSFPDIRGARSIIFEISP
jgi:hypothetical protein